MDSWLSQCSETHLSSSREKRKTMARGQCLFSRFAQIRHFHRFSKINLPVHSSSSSSTERGEGTISSVSAMAARSRSSWLRLHLGPLRRRAGDGETADDDAAKARNQAAAQDSGEWQVEKSNSAPVDQSRDPEGAPDSDQVCLARDASGMQAPVECVG